MRYLMNGQSANGPGRWSRRRNDGNDVGEPDEVVTWAAQHGTEAQLADTAGETIEIDGAITKEDLYRFMASHSEPPARSP